LVDKSPIPSPNQNSEFQFCQRLLLPKRQLAFSSRATNIESVFLWGGINNGILVATPKNP
jgi:hypothetical protein